VWFEVELFEGVVSQHPVSGFSQAGGGLVLSLGPGGTQCLAPGRCGVSGGRSLPVVGCCG
jgi:hypothetical protein